jgi:predicted dehydrogenase
MMDKVRYGLAGFGGIAENRIAKEGFGLDAIHFAPNGNASLVAVTDINQGRREAAEALGCEWCGSFDELVARRDLDAICIATNNASHYDLAKRALLAGKHVFVEKPLATGVEEARELRSMARSRSLSLSVDHMMTKNAYNLEAKKRALGGGIGAIQSICLHMEFLYGSTRDEASSWRCSKREEMGGPIGDVGSHCLYMAEFLLASEVARIGCVYCPRTLDIAVENGAFIQFETRSGIQGTARVAFNQARGGLGGTVRDLGFEIYGDEGTIRSYGTMFQLSGGKNESASIRLEIEHGEEREEYAPAEIPNIYQAQISAHADSIIARAPLDASDALRNLVLLELCHASALSGGAMLAVPSSS